MDTTRTSYDQWVGCDAYDSDGDKVGEIAEIFYDDVTQRPEWAAIKTGLFGSSRSFAPLAGAQVIGETDSDRDDRLQLAVSKDTIKDAPRVDTDDDHLDAADEQMLYKHYGFDWNQRSQESYYGYGRRQATANRFDRDYQSGWRQEWTQGGQPTQGDVVASETVTNEQVVKEAQPQTVRLRKYSWTEQVPVQREEVRLEQEPSGKTSRDA